MHSFVHPNDSIGQCINYHDDGGDVLMHSFVHPNDSLGQYDGGGDVVILSSGSVSSSPLLLDVSWNPSTLLQVSVGQCSPSHSSSPSTTTCSSPGASTTSSRPSPRTCRGATAATRGTLPVGGAKDSNNVEQWRATNSKCITDIGCTLSLAFVVD